MRDTLPEFDLRLPNDVEDAVRLLAELDGAVILQGGTDLLVSMKLKGLRPPHIVSLRKLQSSIGGVYQRNGHICIGTAATFHLLETSPIIKSKLVVLHEAIEQIASYPIRNIATIGGNLCNASPAADSAPPLLVLGAILKIQGQDGEREVPIDKFFTGPGKTALRKGEMLKEIEVPTLQSNSGAAFVKLGRRISEDISVASAACSICLEGKIVKETKIALGSVAPTPIRAYKAEEVMRGKVVSDELLQSAGRTAMGECNPITDVRASADYRKAMVKVLTSAAIRAAAARSSGGAA